jgi:hypothetical protein
MSSINVQQMLPIQDTAAIWPYRTTEADNKALQLPVGLQKVRPDIVSLISSANTLTPLAPTLTSLD